MRKTNQDADLLAVFANLPLERSAKLRGRIKGILDENIFALAHFGLPGGDLELATATPDKVMCMPMRTRWRWPTALNEEERRERLARFASRLRRDLKPAKKTAVGTLRLALGAYHLTTVERAYELAGLTYDTLHALAERNAVGQPPGIVLVERQDLTNRPDWIVRELEVRANGDSRSVHRAHDFFDDVLLTVLISFDPRLIRECDCGRLYAAFRKDAGGCSKPCMNLHRQRKKRANDRQNKELMLRDTRLADEEISRRLRRTKGGR